MAIRFFCDDDPLPHRIKTMRQAVLYCRGTQNTRCELTVMKKSVDCRIGIFLYPQRRKALYLSHVTIKPRV